MPVTNPVTAISLVFCRIKVRPTNTPVNSTMASFKPRTIEPRYLSRLIKKRTRVNVKKDQVFTWEKVII